MEDENIPFAKRRIFEEYYGMILSALAMAMAEVRL